MAQIKSKFIESNAIDGSKLRLSNDQFLRARNAANSADINILKVDTGDIIQFNSVPRVSADPTNANELVRKSYVDAVLQGLKPKEAVRVATTANINLASAPSAIDGVTLASNDRVLVKDQTASEDNGIYVFNGAASAMTRATDFDSLTPINEIKGAYVAVTSGTANAGKMFVCNSDPATLGTDPVTFVFFDAATNLSGGNGIDITANVVSVDLATDPALEFSSAQLRVKVSASGAVQRDSNGLSVKLEASNPTLQIATNELGVKVFSGSALYASASGLGVKLETSNPSLQIASNELGVKFDGAGAITSGASGIKVDVDASTIEISSNALRVKDGGITGVKFNSNVVDASTIKINGSNQLESIKPNEQIITLSGGDISNQYVDLTYAAYSQASIKLIPVGAIPQERGVDFTISLTGGAGGVTRVTFAGDLATGGNAALVAGDKIVISYMYLT